MINVESLKNYFKNLYSNLTDIRIKKLGSGVQGSGFSIEVVTDSNVFEYVLKTLLPEGLGHDYPSDRASVFLLDLDEFKNMPKHVKAIDVLAEMEDGSIKSIGGGREYYLLMEKAEGVDYFNDLSGFVNKRSLDSVDIRKIDIMTSYLAELHSIKKESKALYWRKLRDTVGHGECLMGVLDTYPDDVLSGGEMGEIIKKSVDWYIKLKPKYKRLSQIHGDFHPGNIWFKSKGYDIDFVLLDRSRGPWGEPADDVTALTINYIFFSIKAYGYVKDSYYEGIKLFFDLYIDKTKDYEINEVLAPFFAFRGVVVANPVFYPELKLDQRRSIFNFVKNVLNEDSFDINKVNDYLL